MTLLNNCENQYKTQESLPIFPVGVFFSRERALLPVYTSPMKKQGLYNHHHPSPSNKAMHYSQPRKDYQLQLETPHSTSSTSFFQHIYNITFQLSYFSFLFGSILIPHFSNRAKQKNQTVNIIFMQVIYIYLYY